LHQQLVVVVSFGVGQR